MEKKVTEIKPADPALKQKLGIEPGDKVVSYIGSLSADEGQDELLDACNDLVQQNDSIYLTKAIEWKQFDLKGDNIIRIFADVKVQNGGSKSGVILIKLYDKNNEKISPNNLSLPKSEVFGCSFMYLQDTKGKKAQLVYLESAVEVSYIKVGLSLFGGSEGAKISIHVLEVKSSKLAPSLPVETINKSQEKKLGNEFKVAIIADEFTSNSFSGEFIALPIEPENWLEVFQEKQPDIFLCESAWAGPDSVKRPWRGKIYASINFNKENRTTLLSIIDYCNKAGIPTVFWNKEDPTHHDDRVHDFVKTASLFDYVFTTAEECVESYKKNYKVKNTVVLPFATNPRLFNPIETGERSDHVVAGSWYANHEHRCKVMESILDRLIKDGFRLDLYDRFYSDLDPLHKWPDKYQRYLFSSKPHNEMPGVYKSSVYGLNFNTVTDSTSMFARRVFELMSSNTLVISNYSKGVEEIFGELVIFPDREPSRLTKFSREEVDEIRHKALHKVLEKHTYKQRWQTILRTIGLPFANDEVTLTFVNVVKGKEEALSSISWYQQYGMQFKGSKILLVADTSMDPLNVAKLYQDYNRFGVAVTSYLHADKYSMSGRYCPIETSHFVKLTPEVLTNPERIKEAMLHFQYIDDYPLVLESCFESRHKVKEVESEAILLDKSSSFNNWLSRYGKSKNFEAYLV